MGNLSEWDYLKIISASRYQPVFASFRSAAYAMKRLRHFISLILRPLLDLRYKIRVGRLVDYGVTLRYPPATLLAAQYWEGECNRKEIAVCQLALEHILGGEVLGPRLFEKLRLEETPFVDGQTHWRKLVNAVLSDAIDLQHCAIDVDPSLRIVRGSRWLVMALHYGIPEVRVRMLTKNVPEAHNDIWLAQRGFSATEIAQVNEKLKQMLTRFGATRLTHPSLKALHEKIDNLFRSEHQSFGENGILYQSCEPIERTGQRPTDRRFQIYGLESILKKTDRVLDVGCNCGFFALKVAHYVAYVEGIDITPSLVEIGDCVRQFLKIANCRLHVSDFCNYAPDAPYDVILSFAVHHWIGLPLPVYAARLHSMLVSSGYVLLESQGLRKRDRDFESKIHDFCSAGFKPLQSGYLCDDGAILREYVLLQKHSTGNG